MKTDIQAYCYHPKFYYHYRVFRLARYKEKLVWMMVQSFHDPPADLWKLPDDFYKRSPITFGYYVEGMWEARYYKEGDL